eukprot:Stramenopile-MAST_4_protein_3269
MSIVALESAIPPTLAAVSAALCVHAAPHAAEKKRSADDFGGALSSTKRLCPGWRDALAEQYAGLASDDEKTAFLDRLSALNLQRPGNHDDYLLQRGREHAGRELRRMTGELLSGGGCIFCGNSPATLDQAHVKRDGQATGSSGTVGIGDRPKRRTLRTRALVEATMDGRVGMACINCHRTYDGDRSWIDPEELQAWVQESAQKNRHLVESLVDLSQPRDIDSVRGRFGALLREAETRAGSLHPSRPHVVATDTQLGALKTLAEVHKLPVPQCQWEGCLEQSCLQIDSKYDEHWKWYNSVVENERGQLACLQNGSRNVGKYYRMDTEGRLHAKEPNEDTDTPIIRVSTIAGCINAGFFHESEMKASLQFLCATHNGEKERGRHAEANRKKEVLTKAYAQRKKEKRQTPEETILGVIEVFEKSREEQEVIACCPLEDRETLGADVNLDGLFAKACPHNVGNNCGSTVLIHLAKWTKLLTACRRNYRGAESHVVDDGDGGFYARAEIQVRTNKKPGLKCHFCAMNRFKRPGARDKKAPPSKGPSTTCKTQTCKTKDCKAESGFGGSYKTRCRACLRQKERKRRAEVKAEKPTV